MWMWIGSDESHPYGDWYKDEAEEEDDYGEVWIKAIIEGGINNHHNEGAVYVF